jgi:hypothetical protein
MGSNQALNNAVRAFETALEAKQRDDAKAEAYAIRKGRTLYVVSSEARELRRLDKIYSEARR